MSSSTILAGFRRLVLLVCSRIWWRAILIEAPQPFHQFLALQEPRFTLELAFEGGSSVVTHCVADRVIQKLAGRSTSTVSLQTVMGWAGAMSRRR